MILTFKDLRDQVLRRLDESGDTGTTKSLVNELLNDANRLRATQLANNYLLMDSSFETEVGRQEYSLHEDFVRPLFFRNLATKTYLEEVPDRSVQPEGYDIYNEEGSAKEFALWGRSQLWRQLPVASTVQIVSDSAADDSTAPQIMIRGERSSDGMMVGEILTPNGLTAVTSTVTYRRVTQVTRAGAWTGNMTMTATTGGTTLLVLPYCDLGKSYQQLFLFKSPTAAETISYRFYRAPVKLYNDYDQPDISPPFSQLLVYDALVQIGGYNTEVNGQALSIWAAQQQKWEEALLQATNEGQSLGAHVRFVRPYGGDGTWLERMRGA